MAVPERYRLAREIKPYMLENYMPVTESGCWIWLGKWANKGYANLGGKHGGQASHIFYRAYIGDLLDGMIVCHKCDTPQCVNPSHLFSGTISDNSQDMLKKGRARKADGVRNSNAKLSESQVISILDDPRSPKELSEIYGVRPDAISDIRKGRTWTSLTGIYKTTVKD